MANTTLCQPNGSVTQLPGLDSSSLYCLTPNTVNATAITSMVQVCCASNHLQKMGGCDYCVIDEPTFWSNNTDSDRLGPRWAECLSQQARAFNVSQARASTCNVPESSGAVGLGGPKGWVVWGLVVLLGLGGLRGRCFECWFEDGFVWISLALMTARRKVEGGRRQRLLNAVFSGAPDTILLRRGNVVALF